MRATPWGELRFVYHVSFLFIPLFRYFVLFLTAHITVQAVITYRVLPSVLFFVQGSMEPFPVRPFFDNPY
jgi:hypothetical protein